MSFYPFRRTCKEVAALVVAREDRPLSLGERVGMQLHMQICKACPGFERQILTMRNAMRQWRHYADDATSADAASAPK
jgi:Putative zinc-finger